MLRVALGIEHVGELVAADPAAAAGEVGEELVRPLGGEGDVLAFFRAQRGQAEQHEGRCRGGVAAHALFRRVHAPHACRAYRLEVNLASAGSAKWE
jgi:hypothetical protein